jgi:hypothetical protein
MKLIDHFKKSGFVYREIGLKIRPPMSESGVHRSINSPWRTSIAAFISIAKILGMSVEDAKAEYLASKAAHQDELVTREMKAKRRV